MLNSNAPFRGGKRDLYEGGIRVPMMAWWPGKIQAGSTTDHIGGFQDMLPTFAELAGAQPPAGIDGISIAPTLQGKEGQQQHEYLYWEFTEQGGKQAVRKGPWKSVKLDVSTNAESPIELYNLEEDIAETNNVAAQHPEIIEEMKQIMKEAHRQNKVYPLFSYEKTQPNP